jgi:antitoxin VapB
MRLNITLAVTKALRERYERLQRGRVKASVAELRVIAGRAAAQVKRPYVDHGELLYDEHGLPK